MNPPRHHDRDGDTRRRRVVRTALVLGVVVVAIYLGFIAMGILNAT